MSVEDQLSQLRSHWQLPAAAQFLLSFKDAFGIERISTDDLEIALIGYSGTAWISDLFSKLLRALTLNRNISFSNWEEYLNKEYNKRQSEDNPFTLLSASSFFQLPLEKKLFALHHLCEWQLADPERFRLHLNENEKDSSDWRVDPIGLDSSGCKYWLFDDNRLYKESPFTVPPKTKARGRRTSRANSQGNNNFDNLEPTWELIAHTSNEWTAVADSFRKPKGLQEKHLASALCQVLPSVLENLEQSEQERKHQEALANRKRSSRILVKELERAEQDRITEIRRESRTEQAEYRRSTITARKDEEDRRKRSEARELRLTERERRIRDQKVQISRKDQAAKKAHRKPSKKRESTLSRSSRGISSSSTFSVDGEDDNEDEYLEEEEKEEKEKHWVFDCICGKFGNNMDDGELMIQCERCNIWQHVACVKEAPVKDPGKLNRKEWEDVDFYCTRCREKHFSRTGTLESTTPASDRYDPSARERLENKKPSGASDGERAGDYATNALENHHRSAHSSAAPRKTSDVPLMKSKEDRSGSHVSNVKKIKMFSSSIVAGGQSSAPISRQCAQPVQALGSSDNTRSNAYSSSYTSHQQHAGSVPVSLSHPPVSTRIKLVDHSTLLERAVSNSSLSNVSDAHGTPYQSVQAGASPFISPTKSAFQSRPYPPSSLSSRPPSCPIPPFSQPYDHPNNSPSASHPLHHSSAHHPNPVPLGCPIPVLDPTYAVYVPMENMDHQQHTYQPITNRSYPASFLSAHPSSHPPYPGARESFQYDAVPYGVYSNSAYYPAQPICLPPNYDGMHTPIHAQNLQFPTPLSGQQDPGRPPANDQVLPRG